MRKWPKSYNFEPTPWNEHCRILCNGLTTNLKDRMWSLKQEAIIVSLLCLYLLPLHSWVVGLAISEGINQVLSSFQVSIPGGQIFPINDKKSPEGAAEDYEALHRDLVERKILPLSDATGFPKFDLMLLGMGPDGHVASLFPNHPQRNEEERWVTFITNSPKPPPPRITYTFPVINSSSEIAMVVTGAELATAVKDVLGNPNSNLPAAEVSPQGLLTWFLDKDAASKLWSTRECPSLFSPNKIRVPHDK